MEKNGTSRTKLVFSGFEDVDQIDIPLTFPMYSIGKEEFPVRQLLPNNCYPRGCFLNRSELNLV